MKKVYKYSLPITDRQTVMLPNGFQVVMVGLDPKGLPCLWAIVDPERTASPETVIIVGTGQPLPDNFVRHIGSFVDGRFVWHVFFSYEH